MLYLVGFFIVFIIFLLVIIYFVFKKSPNEPDESTHFAEKETTLDTLIKILVNEKRELARVENALEKMTKRFPFPENEKDAGEHFKFVYYYAKNPLPSAKMIVRMQKMLTEKNPKYAKQIEAFQMRGVEARNK